ncbi:intradiol ring-cleavage dioxygenase [Saccharothrix violaceirubra]|uniref:Protocatechuate 3,4-dioxygenase beta subunit n=1 Tax=Saccharothrix violaceirubra TaxID=413306 RepID=A0A7W7WXD5_9PSEU|nr:3,4-dioxygenase subunit beta [Saccharothrix violaceirubra]MBB4966498.1 protocatechuate 3,4-dioxygenase beta subunit [Saccharothrix violaceirubra]
MTPTYEGRPLPRPDEEVVDQGLGFDLGTLMSRRRTFRTFGLGVAALGIAACSSDSDTGSSPTSATSTTTAKATGEIPDETAGPYPGDGSNGPDVLERSGVVRGDIRTGFGDYSGTAEGVPMTLELTIQDLTKDGAPFAGVAVYVWHCTRDGEYSLYGEKIKDQNYLRGVQIADASGKVTFLSIFPACYSGRWPHIHFEVYPTEADITDATKAIATSQVALPKETCDKVYAQDGYRASVSNLAQVSLAKDNVFGDDSAAKQLATVTGDVTSGFKVSLTAGVDTTTKPTGGGVPPGGDGQPSGMPGGTPPGPPPGMTPSR